MAVVSCVAHAYLVNNNRIDLLLRSGEVYIEDSLVGTQAGLQGQMRCFRVTREQHSEAVFITFTGTSEASTVLEGRL